MCAAGVPCSESTAGGSIFQACFWAISKDASEVRKGIPRHPMWSGSGEEQNRCHSVQFSQQVWEAFKEVRLEDNLFMYSWTSVWHFLWSDLLRSCPKRLELCPSLYLPPSAKDFDFQNELTIAFFSFFFLEDEEDEEMVEPKIGHDSELENQDKKQETKEGKVTKEDVVGR